MTHYFISYARRESRRLARRLCADLNTLNDVSAWMDDSLISGRSWAAQIEAEIARSDYVIVLLTPDISRPSNRTTGRSFVLNEIEYALAHNVTIVPVIVTATSIPIQLMGIQYTDITHLSTVGPQVRAVLQSLPGINADQVLSEQPRFGRIKQGLNIVAMFTRPSSMLKSILVIARKMRLNEPWAMIIAAIITGLFAVYAVQLNNTTPSPTNNLDPTPITATAWAPTGHQTNGPNTPSATPVSSQTPNEQPSQMPGALHFYTTETYWLLRIDASLGTVDLSSLQILWNSEDLPLALHTQVWRDPHNVALLDFTQLSGPICFILIPNNTDWEEQADCPQTYVAEYFSSLADLRRKTQSYSISLLGGRTVPTTETCSTTQAPCQIPYNISSD